MPYPRSMDIATSAAGAQSAGTAVDVAMLKKAQDIMRNQSAQLLEALPEPPPSLPGVGGNVDLRA